MPSCSRQSMNYSYAHQTTDRLRLGNTARLASSSTARKWFCSNWAWLSCTPTPARGSATGGRSRGRGSQGGWFLPTAHGLCGHDSCPAHLHLSCLMWKMRRSSQRLGHSDGELNGAHTRIACSSWPTVSAPWTLTLSPKILSGLSGEDS